MRKTLWLIPLVLVAALASSQWQDIKRYVMIKRLSTGQGGHPEYVPAGGTTSYPHSANGSTEGASDFDSASRGGPKL